MSRSIHPLHGYNINICPDWSGGWYYSVGYVGNDRMPSVLIHTGKCTDYDVATRNALNAIQDDHRKHKESES